MRKGRDFDILFKEKISPPPSVHPRPSNPVRPTPSVQPRVQPRLCAFCGLLFKTDPTPSTFPTLSIVKFHPTPSTQPRLRSLRYLLFKFIPPRPSNPGLSVSPRPPRLYSESLESEKIASLPLLLQTPLVTLDLPPGPIELLADHSLLLLDSRTLVLADTHFGKSAAFRARGLPVPEGDTHTDLARIESLIAETKANHLIIAGDLLHARVGCTSEVLDILLPWLAKAPIPITLVEGNHDALCGKNPLGNDFPLTTDHTLHGFHILHNPDEEIANPDGFHIGGHLHPAVRIKDGSTTGFRSPVFFLRKNQMVLPAFGTFTGGKTYPYSTEHDRLFTPLNGRVVELPPQLWK